MAIARRSRSGVRVLRVLFTDADATDSSGSEPDEEQDAAAAGGRNRVKRHVRDISLDERRRKCHAESGEKRFRGVRQRPWGRFSAEIRASVAFQKRLWLGTFDTAEEAASMYDLAAVRLKGDKAVTNFPAAKKDDDEAEALAAVDCGGGEGSPKSVIEYGEDEDCVGFRDVDDALGENQEGSCFWMPENWEEEEIEFGEIEDFLVSEIGSVG